MHIMGRLLESLPSEHDQRLRAPNSTEPLDCCGSSLFVRIEFIARELTRYPNKVFKRHVLENYDKTLLSFKYLFQCVPVKKIN